MLQFPYFIYANMNCVATQKIRPGLEEDSGLCVGGTIIWGERHLITWHGKARKLVSRPGYGTGKRAWLFCRNQSKGLLIYMNARDMI